MKICGRCHEEKPLSEFGNHSIIGMKQSYCKPCKRAYIKDYYKTHVRKRKEPEMGRIYKRKPIIL